MKLTAAPKMAARVDVEFAAVTGNKLIFRSAQRGYLEFSVYL